MQHRSDAASVSCRLGSQSSVSRGLVTVNHRLSALHSLDRWAVYGVGAGGSGSQQFDARLSEVPLQACGWILTLPEPCDISRQWTSASCLLKTGPRSEEQTALL